MQDCGVEWHMSSFLRWNKCKTDRSDLYVQSLPFVPVSTCAAWANQQSGRRSIVGNMNYHGNWSWISQASGIIMLILCWHTQLATEECCWQHHYCVTGSRVSFPKYHLIVSKQGNTYQTNTISEAFCVFNQGLVMIASFVDLTKKGLWECQVIIVNFTHLVSHC